MKTKKIALVIALLAVSLVISTCGGGGGNGVTGGHTHSWNTETGLCSGCSELYYSLGDTGPGGGKIFYRSETGFTMTDNGLLCHYLEAASSDQGTYAEWGGYGTTITGITNILSTSDAEASRIGNGRKNTQLIVTYLAGTSETGRAAQLCKSYTGGGCTDWFLPSLGELKQLYNNSSSVGNMTPNVYYWSSSQYDSNGAWPQSFFSGYQDFIAKFNTIYVRAIRAF